jgi:hypothetical protein
LSAWQAKRKDQVPSQWFVKIAQKYGVSVDWLVSGVAPPEPQKTGPCSQCTELIRQLTVVNDRLYQASERERALLIENRELQAKISELQYRLSLFADSAESKGNTA